MSITNVVSALKIVNGAKQANASFLDQNEDADFEEPRSYSPGVISCNMDFIINDKDVIPITRKELLEKLNGYKKANKTNALGQQNVPLLRLFAFCCR